MKHFARAALAGALVLTASAQASDGTVTITGSIVGTTCTITPSNGTGGNINVQLPAVAAGNLGSATKVAGRTPFSLSLSGCKNGASTATGTVKAYFETGSKVDPASGRLIVDAGTGAATNVQLELVNSNGSSIKVGDGSTITGATFDTDGKATLNYAVQYYATGAVTAGTANSSVTYSLVYQ